MALPPDALVASAVTVELGGRRILEGVDARVRPGEVLAVLGPNGSGKTTLLRTLAGLQAAQAGTVVLGGTDLARLTRTAVARRVALVLQENPVPFEMTAYDVVRMGRAPHRPALQWDSHEDDAIVAQALERTGASPLADRDFARLSSGERQRVVLARALAQRPRVLLLDEPSSHLDVSAAFQMMDLVRALAKEGVAVAAVLHDLNLALRYADRVLLLDHGRAVAAGTPDEVLTPAALAPVYGIRFGLHRLDGTPTLVPHLPEAPAAP